MGTLVDYARYWGAEKHRGQVRKYTGEAYFTHCEAVANSVQTFVDRYPERFPNDMGEEIVVGALLHDVVEDTKTTNLEIEVVFGTNVAKYVWYLTKPPEFVGDRAKRKKMDRDRLREAPAEARLIKIFDLWHNSKSIKEHDPEFWATFRLETKLLLDSMDAFGVISSYCGRDFATIDFLEWFGEL